MTNTITAPAARPDADYLRWDPFQGDEAELTCRSIGLVKARKAHDCFGVGDSEPAHQIEPGQRYRHERARVDGSFWGQYRTCLRCMDRFIAEGEPNDEDNDD